MNNVELTAKVAELGEVRQVQTRFGPNQVSDNVLEDDSGKQVKLTLWGDQIKQIHVGDTVSITGAYVKSWRGELQVGISRRGTLATGEAAAAAAAGASEAGAATEAAATEEAGAETGAEGAEPKSEPAETEETIEETIDETTAKTTDESTAKTTDETSAEPSDTQITPEDETTSK